MSWWNRALSAGAPVVRTALLLAGCSVVGANAHAQEIGWQHTAQLSGNIWYGAAHARVVATELGIARSDSSRRVHAEFQLGYADDREGDAPRQVTARSMQGSAGLDYRPFDRYSPFLLGTAESNYQQRIALRTNLGVGAKWTLMRKGRDDLSLSLALLSERTRALGDADTSGAAVRTRWSFRFRYRRQLTPTLFFSHVTFYQPAVQYGASRYTIDAVTAVELAITSSVSLTTTLHHRYDSEARRRGAESDNDGQFLVGLRARF
jgi:hypothetical protein